MRFSLPVFNLQCRIWRFGNPTTNPPNVTSQCNLALGRRTGILLGAGADTHEQQGAMWLLLPKATDIQDGKNGVGPDTVEVAAGSGRFYTVVWVDDAGSGFTNEHRFAEIVGQANWPVPFPTVGGRAPAFGGTLFTDVFQTGIATVHASPIFSSGAKPCIVSMLRVNNIASWGGGVQDGLGNVLPVLNARAGLSVGGILPLLQHFLYTPMQDPDVLIVSVPAGCGLAWILTSWFVGARRETGNVSALGPTLSVPTSGATSTPGEIGIASFGHATFTGIYSTWQPLFSGTNNPQGVSIPVIFPAWALETNYSDLLPVGLPAVATAISSDSGVPMFTGLIDTF